MDQIKLELMQRNDLPEVVAIASETKLGTWRVNDYEDELDRKDSYLLSAKKCLTVIGFIAVRFTLVGGADAPIYSEADIINIGVSIDYQSKGIGSLLLNEFLIYAEKIKIKTVWLEVRESNTKAQNFYRLNGFVPVQKRKNFYTEPAEDALVMKINLAGILEISN